MGRDAAITAPPRGTSKPNITVRVEEGGQLFKFFRNDRVSEVDNFLSSTGLVKVMLNTIHVNVQNSTINFDSCIDIILRFLFRVLQ